MAGGDPVYGKHSADVWRIFRIMAELVEGFEMLSEVGPCVTIFGSARTHEDHPHYKLTVAVSRALAEAGYGIISGGGPGLMEAANRGAYEVDKTQSVGLNIQLPFEQTPNPYLKTMLSFRYFFVRKVMFLKYTSAVIIMPGGFGTLDEFFETLTLTQTEKVSSMPLILMGTEFWKGLIDWLRDTMLGREKYISDTDMDLMHITDDPADAVEFITKHVSKYGAVPKFV